LKANLFDSGRIVNNISVVMLARNNSAYLPKLFQILSNLENTYEVKFDYVFIENGSIDNTLELLRDFMVTRDGTITIIGNSSKLDGLPRTVKMATLRNYVKEFVPAQSDWTMLIDTNIYFEKELLEKLFKHQPTEKNIGLLCAFGTDALPDENSGDWLSGAISSAGAQAYRESISNEPNFIL
jgi:glycosyltransferase involved in cell wall biosynthesis